jgi:antitoxin YefM
LLAEILIYRGKDTGVVIISLEEYNSLNATLHEMSSKKNMKVLDASIQQFKEGKFFRRKLIE